MVFKQQIPSLRRLQCVIRFRDQYKTVSTRAIILTIATMFSHRALALLELKREKVVILLSFFRKIDHHLLARGEIVNTLPTIRSQGVRLSTLYPPFARKG